MRCPSKALRSRAAYAGLIGPLCLTPDRKNAAGALELDVEMWSSLRIGQRKQRFRKGHGCASAVAHEATLLKQVFAGRHALQRPAVLEAIDDVALLPDGRFIGVALVGCPVEHFVPSENPPVRKWEMTLPP
jgi:hypothetical protein